jgi:DNA-binding NarL/FixJ family response regulator
MDTWSDGTYTVLAYEAKVRGGDEDAALREIVAEHGGRDIGGASIFRGASRAVRAAVALQRSRAGRGDLGVGLHAGDISPDAAQDAPAVQLAQRMATFATGGRLLASALVRELTRDDPDVRFADGRPVLLPGLAGRMVVHDVVWDDQRRSALRVVIADDAALIRDGLAALLRDHGIEVVATGADAGALEEAVARHLPDVALVDIRMPPTYTDEGLVAAARIRERHPGVGVLVLSQHLDTRYALRVAEASPARTGYLLKDRVTDSRVLFEALERIASGGCVIDPAVAAGLVARADALARIDELTEREREVLGLIAQGCSNSVIAERLVVTQKTVETHIGQIFLKLGLRSAEGEDRRVAAVLAYLRAAEPV